MAIGPEVLVEQGDPLTAEFERFGCPMLADTDERQSVHQKYGQELALTIRNAATGHQGQRLEEVVLGTLLVVGREEPGVEHRQQVEQARGFGGVGDTQDRLFHDRPSDLGTAERHVQK